MSAEQDWLWSKVTEAYRARLTFSLGLLLATITLTGYAFTNKLPGILLATAALPPAMLLLDLFIAQRFVVPFLYAVVITDSDIVTQEHLGALFLEFGREQSSLHAVVAMAPGTDRQRAFRKYFRQRSMKARMAFGLVGSLAEVTLYTYVRWLTP